MALPGQVPSQGVEGLGVDGEVVAADTVEEGILALQARKRELQEAALGEASGAGAISREELLDLLN